MVGKAGGGAVFMEMRRPPCSRITDLLDRGLGTGESEGLVLLAS
jgi:hypothetical protein